jgi:hypothetical protein
MTLLNKIFTYLLVLVIGIFIGSIQKCGGKLKEGKPVVTKKEKVTIVPQKPIEIVKTDTAPKAVSTTKPTHPKYVISIDEFNKMLDSLRYYEQRHQIDSTSYVIVKDSVHGKKTWSQFQYFGKPYIKLVERETTINKTDTLFAEKKRMHFYLTGEAGGNKNQFNYSVGGSVTTKERFVFMYRYGIVDKTHNIGVGLKVF